MDPIFFPLLVLGGFAAGFINTLAGGGSMLTLPLLIFMGLPATVANGTNRVAILIQNCVGVMGFRSKGVRPWKAGVRLCLPACVGAAAGSLVAVRIDPLLLERIFGAVLVIFCFTVFFKPSRLLEGKGADAATTRLSLKTWVVFFAVGFWGGFAQVGVGFLILTGLILCADFNLVYANAVKIMIVLAYTALSLAIFLGNGQVELIPGLVMALGNAGGAWTASVLSVKKGAVWVRGILVGAALLASLKLLGVLDFLWNLFAH